MKAASANSKSGILCVVELVESDIPSFFRLLVLAAVVAAVVVPGDVVVIVVDVVVIVVDVDVSALWLAAKLVVLVLGCLNFVRATTIGRALFHGDDGFYHCIKGVTPLVASIGGQSEQRPRACNWPPGDERSPLILCVVAVSPALDAMTFQRHRCGVEMSLPE